MLGLYLAFVRRRTLKQTRRALQLRVIGPTGRRLTQARKADVDVRTSRQSVHVAFALVATVVVVLTAFAMAQIRGLEDSARDIVQNMLTRVRLVGELDSPVKMK